MVFLCPSQSGYLRDKCKNRYTYVHVFNVLAGMISLPDIVGDDTLSKVGEAAQCGFFFVREFIWHFLLEGCFILGLMRCHSGRHKVGRSGCTQA